MLSAKVFTHIKYQENTDNEYFSLALGENLHEMQNPIFCKNKKKIFQNVICWSFYPH